MYDNSGNIIADSSFYYYYNENGDLLEVKYKGEDYDAASFVYDYDNSISIESHRSGSVNVIWLDKYDEKSSRVASYFYIKGYRNIVNEYNSEEIQSLCKPSYTAYYDENRLIEAVTANEWVRNLKDTYYVSRYELCDYDEAGRMTWNYYMNISSDKLYAVHYLYDTDKLERKIYYLIEGDWEHTIYDGTYVKISRDDSGKLNDITRYNSSGNVMYSYTFGDNDWLDKKYLLYTLNDKGEVLTDWNTADKTLAELEAEKTRNDINTDEENGDKEVDKTQTYFVIKGDCLWSIAEKLFGDGSRWTEIYDSNSAVIGGNADLVYERTELKIVYDE